MALRHSVISAVARIHTQAPAFPQTCCISVHHYFFFSVAQTHQTNEETGPLAIQIIESAALTWFRYFGTTTPTTVLGGERGQSCTVDMSPCIYVGVYMYRISNVWSSWPWSSNLTHRSLLSRLMWEYFTLVLEHETKYTPWVLSDNSFYLSLFSAAALLCLFSEWQSDVVTRSLLRY